MEFTQQIYALQKEINFNKLFSESIQYELITHNERIHLDETDLKNEELLLFLLDHVANIITSNTSGNLYVSARYYICDVPLDNGSYVDDYIIKKHRTLLRKAEKNRLKVLKEFNHFNLQNNGFLTTILINTLDAYDFPQSPENVDGRIYSLHFSTLNIKQLKLLIWADICRYFNKFLIIKNAQYISQDIHLFSIDNRVMFRIYDDRGMDIVRW